MFESWIGWFDVSCSIAKNRFGVRGGKLEAAAQSPANSLRLILDHPNMFLGDMEDLRQPRERIVSCYKLEQQVPGSFERASKRWHVHHWVLAASMHCGRLRFAYILNKHRTTLAKHEHGTPKVFTECAGWPQKMWHKGTRILEVYNWRGFPWSG